MTRVITEIDRLAHVLRVPVERLSYLSDVPDEDIKAYRLQVVNGLDEAARDGSARAAKAVKLVPMGVAVKIVESTGNSLLTARIAGAADPAWAVEIGKRLSSERLAGMAREMPPAKAIELLEGIGDPKRAEVVDLLTKAEDWITLEAIGE